MPVCALLAPFGWRVGDDFIQWIECIFCSCVTRLSSQFVCFGRCEFLQRKEATIEEGRSCPVLYYLCWDIFLRACSFLVALAFLILTDQNGKSGNVLCSLDPFGAFISDNRGCRSVSGFSSFLFSIFSSFSSIISKLVRLCPNSCSPGRWQSSVR